MSVDAYPVVSHIITDRSEKRIYFAPRTLSSLERNYEQIEWEGLTVFFFFEFPNFINIFMIGS